MDISVGKVTLNKRQFERINDIKIDGVNGFTLSGDELFAVATREITEKEKQVILTAVQKLDAVTPTEAEANTAVIDEIKEKEVGKVTLEDVVTALRIRGIF